VALVAMFIYILFSVVVHVLVVDQVGCYPLGSRGASCFIMALHGLCFPTQFAVYLWEMYTNVKTLLVRLTAELGSWRWIAPYVERHVAHVQ